ncbi:uncharacterized protein TRIADDRAFT_55545 [Trichoplax adhaerens]|uniref:Negative elongation factor D n=1 Tax=Trichoplax adhaerens TaxID=10228 RepID=B3RV68_TRIAD|nr:hypothetical protein TRIADDRAFT_55545 [Trichoplax adhaerens]EDV25448.1 hypothetical protein TRIADDRAFT_55545 [Trichoplax adhaerens]|eukprot:XP_002111481.1 hypothetical protein TRIADDRAFT_55545 [Trichoplax adhaerens]
MDTEDLSDNEYESYYNAGDFQEEQPDNDHNADDEDTMTVIEECKRKFSNDDSVMESDLIVHIRKYIKAGGTPEELVQLLSDHYIGEGEVANAYIKWLQDLGVKDETINRTCVEHLREVVISKFDPAKADSLFIGEGKNVTWLQDMIAQPFWRNLFYCLAERFPDCLVCKFAVRLISDAGYQDDINNISTVCQHLELFTRQLQSCVHSVIAKGPTTSSADVDNMINMACHTEHGYLCCQFFLRILLYDIENSHLIRFLMQKIESGAISRGLAVSDIAMIVNGVYQYTNVNAAVNNIFSRNALDSTDVATLYEVYSGDEPPPIEIIRHPRFLDLLIKRLFDPDDKIDADLKSKLCFLLAYAVSVVETISETQTLLNTDDLKSTTNVIGRTLDIISHADCRSSNYLLSEIGNLYQYIRYPVVGRGLINWVDCIVSSSSFFNYMGDSTALIYLAILDEICTHHPLQHPTTFNLLIKFLEYEYNNGDIMLILRFKRHIIECMVHLVSRGYVVPVLNYIRKCLDTNSMDNSLIRNFVSGVLDIISPPYTPIFIELFLPLLKSDVCISLRQSQNKDDPAVNFIDYCETYKTSAIITDH